MQVAEDEINTIEVGSIIMYDPENVPPEHCFYCLCHSPASLLLCESSQKWFCSMVCQRGTHISWHREFTGNTVWSFHPLNPRWNGRLACERCNKTDISMLSLADYQNIFCRKCAINEKNLRPALVLEEILSNGRILDKILEEPSEYVRVRCRNINKKQIKLIENNISLGRDPFSGLDDNPDFGPPMTRIKRIYENAEEYSRIYTELVIQDMRYNEKLSSTAKIANIKISFDRNIARFKYDTLESGLKLRVGSYLEIYDFNSKTKICDSVVSNVNSQNNKVTVKLLKNNLRETNKRICEIKTKFIPIPYERMIDTLQYFAQDCIDHRFKNIVLGKSIQIQEESLHIDSDGLSAPNLPPLNESQKDAVLLALKRNFSIIQGPPGTGKTHSCATLVWLLCKYLKNRLGRRLKVLVTSNSNVAVDNLVERISKTGVKVVKVAARLREKIRNTNQVVEKLSSHNILREKIYRDHPNIQDLYDLKFEYDEVLESAQYKALMEVVKPALTEILEGFDVICCTNIVAADDRLSDFEFPFVIIDEANQSIEPETLIPLLFGLEKLVLVGDQMQLGPISKCNKTVTAGLTRSLMTRMIHLGHEAKVLQWQYRMHPVISEFPRTFFYNGDIIDGISSPDRPLIANLWPNEIPNIFLHNESSEASTGGACSVSNTNEAFNAVGVILKFREKGIELNEIVVLTPYEAQKRAILEICLMKKIEVKVYNVDEFQGNEVNYLIFSTVRSNTDGDIGFLNDFRRMNVAITRAKYGMVILGNWRTLVKSRLWVRLIDHYQQKHMIFEGVFGNLRMLNVEVPFMTPYNFIDCFPYST